MKMLMDAISVHIIYVALYICVKYYLPQVQPLRSWVGTPYILLLVVW